VGGAYKGTQYPKISAKSFLNLGLILKDDIGRFGRIPALLYDSQGRLILTRNVNLPIKMATEYLSIDGHRSEKRTKRKDYLQDLLYEAATDRSKLKSGKYYTKYAIDRFTIFRDDLRKQGARVEGLFERLKGNHGITPLFLVPPLPIDQIKAEKLSAHY
jgi:hypothetical protein